MLLNWINLLQNLSSMKFLISYSCCGPVFFVSAPGPGERSGVETHRAGFLSCETVKHNHIIRLLWFLLVCACTCACLCACICVLVHTCFTACHILGSLFHWSVLKTVQPEHRIWKTSAWSWHFFPAWHKLKNYLQNKATVPDLTYLKESTERSFFPLLASPCLQQLEVLGLVAWKRVSVMVLRSWWTWWMPVWFTFFEPVCTLTTTQHSEEQQSFVEEDWRACASTKRSGTLLITVHPGWTVSITSWWWFHLSRCALSYCCLWHQFVSPCCVSCL